MNWGLLLPMLRARGVDFAIYAQPGIDLGKKKKILIILPVPLLEHSRSWDFLHCWGAETVGTGYSNVSWDGDRAAVWEVICFVSDPLLEILLPSSHTVPVSSCSFFTVFASLMVLITPSVVWHEESLPMWLKEGMEAFGRNTLIYNDKANQLFFVNAENCLSFNKLH